MELSHTQNRIGIGVELIELKCGCCNVMQADDTATGSGLDLAYYSLNGTPDHQPVPHRLLASSMGRSLDEAFVTSSYCEYSEYSGDSASGRVSHHRTSSQPSKMITTSRAVDYIQSTEPCGGSMDFSEQPGRLCCHRVAICSLVLLIVLWVGGYVAEN